MGRLGDLMGRLGDLMGGLMRRLSPRTRWALAAAAVVLLALCSCLLQGVAVLRFREPRPDVTAGLGQPVTIDGVTFRLDTFTVATQLPARRDPEPVRAMAGAVLVNIVLTVRVDDASRDLTRIYCFPRLTDPAGRRWQRHFDEYRVAGPERTTCSANKDFPVVVGRAYQVGATFQVPADAGPRVSVLMETGSGEEVVEFRR
jgi:hypothetical protein